MEEFPEYEATDEEFQWPDPPYPVASWWMVFGSELGLTQDQVRFAASMCRLGGVATRNNSAAAKLAGLTMSRTEAFRLAKSVKVRKLLTAAEQIKTGKAAPLTEQQIDERIDQMCKSPIDRDAAVGIRLRDERRAAAKARGSDAIDPEEEIAALIKSAPMSGSVCEYRRDCRSIRCQQGCCSTRRAAKDGARRGDFCGY